METYLHYIVNHSSAVYSPVTHASTTLQCAINNIFIVCILLMHVG